MIEIITLLLILFFIILSAYFSGSETGIISLNRLKIMNEIDKGRKDYGRILNFINKPEGYLAALLIGTNITNVTASVLSTKFFANVAGIDKAVFLNTVITAPIILYFAEIMPKLLFRRYPHKLISKTHFLVNSAHIIFWPIVKFTNISTAILVKILRIEKENKHRFINKETLRYVLSKGEEDGTLSETEQDMIEEVLDLGITTAREVMIPLIDTVMFDAKTPIDEFLKEVKNQHYSRYPVYRERIDNIIGTVNIFDYFYASAADNLNQIIRKVKFVPETKPVDDLIVYMQKHRLQMVVVVDEFGGPVGIVSLEDLIEEIVGEIEDEYDERDNSFVKLSEDEYLVDGSYDIDDLNEKIRIKLSQGDYDTLSGLVLYELGHVPSEGEKVRLDNAALSVIKMDDNKIEKIKLSLKDKAEADETENKS